MRIDIRNLDFSYPGRKVLHDINVIMDDSEIVCLVGPNGSGKSTIVKCIESLLVPDKGRILLDGKESRNMKRIDMAKKIGYVPQSSNLTFSTTVFDVVLMGRRPHSSWQSSMIDIDIVIDILVLLELEDIALRQFNRLSGGQQQRVLIARAMAQHPELLLLDEPTSALDIAHQLDIMNIITDFVNEKNMSVVMVVHDLNLAARYADSIIMLKNGKIYAKGKPEEVFTKENLAFVYDVEAAIGSQKNKVTIIPIARNGCRLQTGT
ncbi:ABC transporter ATP-binding protein [Desulfobacula phenolica]|uniref:Iron complex transport system ATP-binding protein n=1 Tax=Desulfobacula phenolica TaxID=90732 RepID=A0A1H2HBM0_9BACT|nr:ABC transporter ATP-binding protein [Desulfobacula phenolica]SDU29291.1 iron complex transport system ATP-binding protein [Desulfobacula phenolica]